VLGRFRKQLGGSTPNPPGNSNTDLVIVIAVVIILTYYRYLLWCVQAHVVYAFEQSLVNMTQRLQRLAASTDEKVSKHIAACIHLTLHTFCDVMLCFDSLID